MERHYYLSDDLDDLEAIETELEDAGISTPQIHVLSENDADVETHHLHEVDSFSKSDITHSTKIGAVIGLLGASVVLLGAQTSGFTETVGWIPFIFLALIVVGFFAWEGGLFGIEVPNVHFKRFQQALHDGKHVLFVELDPEQEPILKRVLQNHPRLAPAGDEHTSADTKLVINVLQRWKRFVNWAP